MARTTNSNRGRSSSRSGSKNNNPEGHNQYSGGFTDLARERPIATAAAAAAAVGAGVFLWSRRGQISDQLSSLSDQISEWSENRRSEMSDGSASEGEGEGFMAQSTSSRGRGGKSQSRIAKEAMAMKENGNSTTHPADPVVEEQTKVGSVAY
ncbi:hypothetical protein G7078_07480 [Sphingomonas sinipercae]|uniref:Uncharacterized protein n=1 Tax=Sphingomonas sinipercae TaxID=2714944 RepID=A0A6G7ZNT9_9SPHN|nr:hypothetical protein [Sphingomonas sinipercae]QIL02641.1 hypothetical protein G7078_07480 [Sphingomonas sinipercae]